MIQICEPTRFSSARPAWARAAASSGLAEAPGEPGQQAVDGASAVTGHPDDGELAGVWRELVIQPPGVGEAQRGGDLGPDGDSDIIARLMAQYLSQKLGQQFVVENHPGAATNLAAEYVARVAPDGHTLLLLTSANTVNATLYTKLNFNCARTSPPSRASISYLTSRK